MKNLVKHICILICLVAFSGNAWGGTATITEDFEMQTAGITYNSTQTYTAVNSNAGIAWFVEHGTVSTTAYLDGSKSMHMRAYYAKSSASDTWNGNLPYVNSTTDVKGLISITFNAAVSNTGLKMDVMYSTNSGSSWSYMYKTSASSGTNASAITFSNTSKASYTYYIPSAALSPTGNFRIKIAVNSGSTHADKPSKADNYTFRVDNIAFTYTAYTVTYSLNGGSGTTPTETSKTSGATFTLHNGTSSITAPTGKSFSQWKDQDDNLYNGGATYTMPAKNVTLTAQWSCITPTISADPSSATYWDMDSPTALTVTASGGSLSYQWQKSADGSSSWSNVGTNSSSYTPLVANGTQYYRCIVTNTGSSCSTTATSKNALITIKTLSSITVKTSPKTTYFAGETFDPTGLVITLTASDATTQDRSYATYSSGFTFSPTTATALTTSDDAVTITYGGQSDDLSVSVYSVTVNKVDDAGNSVSADGVTATWTVGTKALAAGYGSTQYRFKEWAFNGSNNGLSITNTGSANTTITGTPTGNVTIKAIFYAPRTIKWSVNGDDSYDTGSPTESVPYGTQWKNLTLPTDPAPGSCSGSDKFMGWIASELDHDLDKTDDASDITTLEGEILNSSTKSSRTTEITAATTTFYAVFADYAE